MYEENTNEQKPKRGEVNPVEALLKKANGLEAEAKSLRWKAQKYIPEMVKDLAEEVWERADLWEIDPQLLVDEIYYASGAKERPGIFLTDKTGTERYTKGALRHFPWLKEMRKQPDYSLAQHYKMSMEFASEESIPLFEEKIAEEEKKEKRKRNKKK